jgi:hypothetical protein
MENARAYFSKNGKLKTKGEKYSSSLKENPLRSTAFTNPEAINIMETRYRKSVFIVDRSWLMEDGSLQN